jgi:hypothetical protein
MLSSIEKDLLENNEVILYCPKELFEIAESSGVKVIYDKDDLRPNAVIRRFDYLYKKYLIPLDFSKTYYRRFSYTKAGRFHRHLNRLLAFKRRHNIRYVRVFTALRRLNLLPVIAVAYDEIHLCTKLWNSIAFVGLGDYMVTYQESWDHPQKGPYFFTCRVHYCWPLLLQDTKKYQDGFAEIYSLQRVPKFDYLKRYEAKSFSVFKSSEFIEKYKGKYYIYPVCTSSSYHQINRYEISFIMLLAQICIELNIPLLIRPYPLAPIEDLKVFSVKNGLVCIDDSVVRSNGYEIFDSELMGYKKYQLLNARGVINVGTTFALDAASLNVPVLQLNLSKNFGAFSEVSRYEHIKSYLNDGLAELDNETRLKEMIANSFMEKQCIESLREFLNIDKNS